MTQQNNYPLCNNKIMANKPLDTAFVDKAIKFAVDAHAGTERRGKAYPYVIHVLEAMSIVSTITNDPELLAAAALHDTVEDTDVSIDTIRAEFGDKVADLVYAETDRFNPGVSETDSWRERKQAAISRIEKASREAKIVALGDKLSNMRAIAMDFAKAGDKLWSIFHAPGGRADHEWHYRGLAMALSDLAGSAAYTEFTRLIANVFGGPRPELINMDDYEVSGDGFTAISYFSKDGTKMIKLYADFVPEAASMQELKVAWALTDMGLSTPRAHRLVTDGKRVGVEFDRIQNKRSFSRAISQEPEKLEEYTRQFARMCRKLHETPCNTDVFNPVELRFLGALTNSKHYTEEEKNKIASFIKNVPSTTTCLHGDMHIGNALIADGKEYWIDLGDFAYGNPLYDMGMLYFVCHATDAEEITQRLYHISSAQIHQVWDIFVDEYFGHDADKEEIARTIAPFAALYMMFYEDRGGLLPGMKEFIQNQLLK